MISTPRSLRKTSQCANVQQNGWVFSNRLNSPRLSHCGGCAGNVFHKRGSADTKRSCCVCESLATHIAVLVERSRRVLMSEMSQQSSGIQASIYSRLDYCNSALDGITNVYLNLYFHHFYVLFVYCFTLVLSSLSSFLPERDYVTFGSLLSQFRLSVVGGAKRKRGIKIQRFWIYRRLYLINGTR